MLNKVCMINRGRWGLLRLAAVVVGFLCVLHVAHRECAKSTDRPFRAATVPAGPESKGTPSHARSAEVFHATAYCITGLTTAGVPVIPGYAAADPKVIPLGSMIYVETPFMTGVYQVMDTGELIKGKIIDIFIPSYQACVDFGRRVVKVKVLRYGFDGEHPSQKTAASKK